MSLAEGVRVTARTVGELLITAGLVLLLFAAYLMWGTNLKTAAAQDDLRAELRRAWAAADVAPATEPGPATADPGAATADPGATTADPGATTADPGATTADPGAEEAGAEPAVLPGDAYALLRFPTLGGAEHVVVEGVSVADLRKGPGHYPGTAAPGEVGNVVLSGHRTTYGAPFGPIGELLPGDPVEVQTADGVHVYRVTGSEVVAPTAIEVTYPVPGEPGATPTERLLTLTTCHPRYSAEQRLIVRAVLEGTAPSDAASGVA